MNNFSDDRGRYFSDLLIAQVEHSVLTELLHAARELAIKRLIHGKVLVLAPGDVEHPDLLH